MKLKQDYLAVLRREKNNGESNDESFFMSHSRAMRMRGVMKDKHEEKREDEDFS
jgi:hypothetical protein